MTADGRPLRDSLEDYLALRRALGFRLKTAGRLLDQFVSWLDDRGSDTITTEDALAWAVLPPGASQAWQSIRLSMVRGFAAYLHGTDPSVQVPPPGLIRRGNDRATPYIYSDAEISAIIAAADSPAAPVPGRHLPDPDRPSGSQRRQDRGSALLRSRRP